MEERNDYLSWDEYFMGVARISAMRSKDPEKQVGACIVSQENRILSCGYNGAPNGFDDASFPWKKDGNPLNTKYMYVCHATLNAILSYGGPRNDMKGGKLYITDLPCHECAKAIAQSGIKTIIYASDKSNGTESNMAAKKLYLECGIDYIRFDSKKKIEIDFYIK